MAANHSGGRATTSWKSKEDHHHRRQRCGGWFRDRARDKKRPRERNSAEVVVVLCRDYNDRRQSRSSGIRCEGRRGRGWSMVLGTMAGGGGDVQSPEMKGSRQIRLECNIYSWGFFKDCSDRFTALTPNPLDEERVIAGTENGLISLVGILPNRVIQPIAEHSEYLVERLAFSHDRKFLGSISHDSVLKVCFLCLRLFMIGEVTNHQHIRL
ncbi:putative transcription factor WD40-like family [Helianthus anomalus]